MLCESTWLKVVWIKGRHQWKKKNVFFWELPGTLIPPLTPVRATWSFFFGRQNSRFESHLMGGEGDILAT